MKCEECIGCPFLQDYVGGLDPRTNPSYFSCEHKNDCRLTPSKYPIIRNLLERDQSEDILRFMEAASRNAFDCGHCEKFGQCPETLPLDPPMIRAAEAWWPCEEYQERKEDGE